MKKHFYIPNVWEELTPVQFSYLLRLVIKSKPDEITIDNLLVKFADWLLGEKQYFRMDRRIQYYKLVDDVAGRLDWIFRKEDDRNIVLDVATTQNLLPVIGKFLGPQSHGSDLSFGEYRTAVDMMNRYGTEQDPFYLDALCGILYRFPAPDQEAPTFDGNFRQKFNKYHIEQYAHNFTKIPEHLKWGVYLWFAYFCRYLIEGGEFIIDGNTLSFEPLFEREPDGDDQEKGIGLISIVFTLADTGTFGNAEKTEETLLFPVLLKLLHDKQMSDKLKKAYDRN